MGKEEGENASWYRDWYLGRVDRRGNTLVKAGYA